MSVKYENSHRRFSEEIKRESIRRIDEGQQSLSSLSRELKVSRSTLYKWMAKYSVTYQKQTRVVVEKNSQSSQIERLQKELLEAQAALGRKQLEVDYLRKVIEIAKQEDGIDVLKKEEIKQLLGSQSTENPDPGG